ncbi:MAG: symmetrical bis(5'-nucleosyl)-tetraphosphatase [bacterium]|nr:symmetrical bis(5'-nucleosyl)-tetraphosphatase [bacterium]
MFGSEDFADDDDDDDNDDDDGDDDSDGDGDDDGELGFCDQIATRGDETTVPSRYPGLVATYAIGDIHGCWLTLQRLLRRIEWDKKKDRLLLVGDLVNRGSSSLEVLRWAYSNRDTVTAVLGNHDLHLLARSIGARTRPDDTLDEVLSAPDRDELLDWVRKNPLAHLEDNMLLVHAGVHPDWSLDDVSELAPAASRRLNEEDGLETLYDLRKTMWRAGLCGDTRLAAALALMTSVRVVTDNGHPVLAFTGKPQQAPPSCKPWFESSRLVQSGVRIIFGHWAMLGVSRCGSAICLDSGCHWGGALTAMRLEDEELFSEPVADSEAWTGP